jgi:hypothetical protein
MSIIFNLVLFLVIISILLIICNNFAKDEDKIKTYENKEILKSDPKTITPVIFDYEKYNYETVPENKKKFILEEKFNKDQQFGAQIVPKYEPPKGEENKEFYKKDHSDQPIIYDYRMYEKPIHNDRTIIQNIEKELPSKISDVYDASIVNFKDLVPKMKGQNTTVIVDGGFNTNAYTPDFMYYDDEKQENGGIIPKLYNQVFANDTLLEIECAKF